MLLYVRHGETDNNEHGLAQGWEAIPLSSKGIEQAKKAGEQLARIRPDTFAASDIKRAAQTGQIIGKQIGAQAQPDPLLRTWNHGITGTRAEVNRKLQPYIDNPDAVPPGGQSLNAYLQHIVPAIKSRVASPGIHLVVGHGRGTTVLGGLASPIGGVGDAVDKAYLAGEPLAEPGDVLSIGSDWGIGKLNHRMSSLDRLRSAI